MRFAIGLAIGCLLALWWLSDCVINPQPPVSAQGDDESPFQYRCISAWADGQVTGFRCWYPVFGLAADG